ncbi:MAG: hypothetical protein LBG06_00015 [Deltaproteobacteria bacterium]|jgi:hypothetical protein|nr:hypothetical protein [Deltaproteobacteria bacterium]
MTAQTASSDTLRGGPAAAARPRPRRWGAAALAAAVAALTASLACAPELAAQGPFPQTRGGRLSGLEKQQLLAIAAEPLAAIREGREPRMPQVSGNLAASLPLAVSLYLDGELVARSWEIKRPGPLAASAMALAARALTGPSWGSPTAAADVPRLKAGILVLHGFIQIKDDTQLPDGHGAVVMNGFKEGVAGPMDAPPGAKPSEILSFASRMAGMRPGGWMIPESTLFASPADEAREE